MKRGLLIVARNLGDAVVSSGFAFDLSFLPDTRWIIWCRPEVAFLFKNQPSVEKVLCNQFPMGTDKKFDITEAISLVRSLVLLRRLKIDISLDLIGDFREVGLARLSGSQTHYSLVWPNGHSFKKLIRPSPLSWIQRPFSVSEGTKNVYLAYSAFVKAVFSDLNAKTVSANAEEVLNEIATPSKVKIGLHPFASQESKLWPQENWRLLAASLVASNVTVIAFGGPQEKRRLREIFKDILSEDALVCTQLSGFFDEIKQLDALVGLDSLSVHAAHRVGIPSIMLIGASEPSLWAPPSCSPLTSIALCGNQPCFNVPTCRGTAFQFDCMKHISPNAVLDETFKSIERRGNAQLSWKDLQQ